MTDIIGLPEIEKDLRKLMSRFPEAAKKAHKAAILRVSRSMLSRVVRFSAKRARVKAKLIRGRSSNKPIPGKPGRIVRIGMYPIPLAIMGPKGRPVSAKKRGKGVKVAGHDFPRAFIGKAKLGKRPGGVSVFQRVGKAQYPIEEIRIPVAEHINAVAPTQARAAVNDRFEKELTHNLTREIDRQIRRKNQRVIKLIFG